MLDECAKMRTVVIGCVVDWDWICGVRLGLGWIRWDFGIRWGSGDLWGLYVLLFSLFQFLDEVVCTGDCVGDNTFY